MSNVRRFIEDESRHERALAKAMNWEYIEGQEKGSCYDFIAPDGAKIEAKLDWDSIKWGNHYLEYAHTSDDGETVVDSGFTISAKEADYWVVVNEDYLRLFKVDVLSKFIETHGHEFEKTTSRAGVNHNRPGQYSLGYKIPMVRLDQHCILKILSPVKRVHT